MDNPTPSPFENVPPVGGSQPGLARCAVHPNVAATFCCRDCGRTLCDTCGFNEEDGNIVCTECMARRRPPPVVVVPELDSGPVDPELARKMAEKSDLELLDMFESPDDWRPESLDAARAELRKRNIAEPLQAASARVQDGASERIEVASNLRRSVITKCSYCGRENADDAEYCYECGTKLEEVPLAQQPDVAGQCDVAIRSPDSASPPISKSPPVRVGIMCAQHPKVQAIQQCRRCGGFMCATCDFAFPGDVHFCPTCVSRGDEGLSRKRRKFMIWSLVLAAWSTVGMTCLVSGALRGMARTKEDRTALGWVLIIFVLGPAITGLSLGMTAKRKQASNPAALWIAIIWNAILVTSYVVLTLIGLSRQ